MALLVKGLGDLKAEDDHAMLEAAFLETSDFRTLLESDDKVVVVGRRGTGKSALTYRLEKEWEKGRSFVIKLAPEEAQVIGIRPLLNMFDDDYSLIRAALKITWECAVYCEITVKLESHYKYKNSTHLQKALALSNKIHLRNRNVAYNLRVLLKKGLDESSSPEEAIADLAELLSLASIKGYLKDFFDENSVSVKVLIDCLDEGYKPDTMGVSYIAGIIQGTQLINSSFDSVRALLFIRDNMFRAVSSKDPDYTRNIEGSALRLHWSENQLLNLVAKRLRVAFHIDQENDIRVWNTVAKSNLSGRDGFRKCLRLTLYRPRDLIALLNLALYTASKDDRLEIVEADIEVTAREISQTRLDDLAKEYQVIFPSISAVISCFKSVGTEFNFADIKPRLNSLITSTDQDKRIQQEMAFFDCEHELIKALYSIGFLGIRDTHSGAYSFCHDGRDPDLSISDVTELSVHPCYQVALNITNTDYTELAVAEIHDDYEIEISSVSQEQRNRKIGQLVARLRNIDAGRGDAAEFEDWCLDAIKTIFAGDLVNVQLHPNKDAPQRRDVVGTNVSTSGFWKRVLDDYCSRQIIFEVKNYADLKPDDYRQISSYLIDSYGRLGFIVCRTDSKEPNSERDLVWVREMYWKQEPKKLIIVLSYKHLTGFLEKIRNPQKHDAVDRQMEKLLDTYLRQYLNESVGGSKRKK